MNVGHEHESYESASAIIEAVGGPERLSRNTLAKWHRAGLIPRPKTAPLGLGKGSESRYPVGTLALVQAILNRKKSRLPRLDNVASDLWWQGHPVPFSTIRTRLEKFASQWDECLSKRDIETDLRTLESGKVPPSVARVRKRVGRDKIRGLANAAIATVSGRVDESAIDQVDERTYIKAFKLERATKDRLTTAGPVIRTKQGELLHYLSPLLRGRSMVETLAKLSEIDITTARDCVRNLFGVVGHAEDHADTMYGKGAFGFGTLRELGTPKTWQERAVILLLWPLLMADIDFQKGLGNFLKIEDTLVKADRLQEHVKLLRREVPAVVRVTSPRRIGAALKNKKKQAKLNADILRVRKSHGADIQAFVARHGHAESIEPDSGESVRNERASTGDRGGTKSDFGKARQIEVEDLDSRRSERAT